MARLYSNLWVVFTSGTTGLPKAAVVSNRRLLISAGLFYKLGAFVTEVSNYSDPVSETFHMRCVFDDRQMSVSLEEFRQQFEAVAQDFGMLSGAKGTRLFFPPYRKINASPFSDQAQSSPPRVRRGRETLP